MAYVNVPAPPKGTKAKSISASGGGSGSGGSNPFKATYQATKSGDERRMSSMDNPTPSASTSKSISASGGGSEVVKKEYDLRPKSTTLSKELSRQVLTQGYSKLTDKRTGEVSVIPTPVTSRYYGKNLTIRERKYQPLTSRGELEKNVLETGIQSQKIGLVSTYGPDIKPKPTAKQRVISSISTGLSSQGSIINIGNKSIITPTGLISVQASVLKEFYPDAERVTSKALFPQGKIVSEINVGGVPVSIGPTAPLGDVLNIARKQKDSGSKTRQLIGGIISGPETFVVEHPIATTAIIGPGFAFQELAGGLGLSQATQLKLGTASIIAQTAYTSGKVSQTDNYFEKGQIIGEEMTKAGLFIAGTEMYKAYSKPEVSIRYEPTETITSPQGEQFSYRTGEATIKSRKLFSNDDITKFDIYGEQTISGGKGSAEFIIRGDNQVMRGKSDIITTEGGKRFSLFKQETVGGDLIEGFTRTTELSPSSVPYLQPNIKVVQTEMVVTEIPKPSPKTETIDIGTKSIIGSKIKITTDKSSTLDIAEYPSEPTVKDTIGKIVSGNKDFDSTVSIEAVTPLISTTSKVPKSKKVKISETEFEGRKTKYPGGIEVEKPIVLSDSIILEGGETEYRINTFSTLPISSIEGIIKSRSIRDDLGIVEPISRPEKKKGIYLDRPEYLLRLESEKKPDVIQFSKSKDITTRISPSDYVGGSSLMIKTEPPQLEPKGPRVGGFGPVKEGFIFPKGPVKIGTIPSISTNIGQGNIQKPIQEPSLMIDTKPQQIPDIALKPIVTTTPDSIITTTPISRIGSAVTPETVQDFSYYTFRPSFGGFNFPTPSIPPAKLKIGRLLDTGGKRKPKKKVKGKAKYTPTLEASLFNIKGPEIKLSKITGLELRPIAR